MGVVEGTQTEMRIRTRTAATIVAGILATAGAGQPVDTLVIGDSLSYEYALEFPVLFPDNPESWDSRNWVEILHARRSAYFDFGGDPEPFDYDDAVPGYEAADYRDDLDDSDGWIPAEVLFREIIDSDIAHTDRTVVFLGGNDLDRVYGAIYEGADPAAFIDGVVDDLAFIIDYVRTRNPDGQMVLVNLPHIGVTPDIQSAHPTDPVKTRRVTEALRILNGRLESLASSRGIGLADVFGPTLDLLEPAPLCIAGVRILKEVDPDARPQYLFPGDGFHPNTAGQALFANAILEAFNETYSENIPLLAPGEIVQDVLGLQPVPEYRDWIAGFPGIAPGEGDDPDRDGMVNLVEYLFDLDPSSPDRHRLPVARVRPDPGGDQLEMSWRIRPETCPSARVVPRRSADRIAWAPLPEDLIEDHGDGAFTARVSVEDARGFLRLDAEPSY